MRRRAGWIVLFVLSVFVLSGFCMPAGGQGAAPVCGAAPIVAATAHPNIFTAEQEQWLGDAMADYIEADYRPARDASESEHLQVIADRLVATLPPTGIKFRVLLVDSSTLNGFSIAGGHIYIMRKLAATAQNDDELASVIGHEIGHIASHQFAFETTADLKRLLGVTSVGDRADVTAKFLALMEARARDKHPAKEDDDTKQDEADRIGVYVTAAAGYSSKALAEFWDRSFFVNGQTGDRVGDFFGMTKPDEKRLRGMRKMAAALPAGCGATSSASSQEFAAWHRKVVANQTGDAGPASEAGKEVMLTPPLRLDIDRLHFSRDGKMALAQDAGSVFVMSTEPFALQFRFDAENALPAVFSPDSTRVLTSTPGLHTEEWSVADKSLITAHEVLSQKECWVSRLSPDGRTLICVSQNSSDNLVLDVALLDVATGAKLWEKQEFEAISFWNLVNRVLAGADADESLLPLSFSSDGNAMLMGVGDNKAAFDLRTRTPIKIGGDLKGKIYDRYAFLSNDRVVGGILGDHNNAEIVTFPEGVRMEPVQLSWVLEGLEGVSNGGADELVLGHGIPDYGVVLTTLPGGAMMGLKTSAMDVWKGTRLAESVDGSVSMAKLGNTDAKLEKRLMLPLSPLGGTRSGSVSQKGRYLALSARTRGGVWDLSTGKQIFLLHGFTDSTWADDDVLYIEVPKVGSVERHMVRLSMQSKAVDILPYKVDDDAHMHEGHLMEWKPGGKKAADLTMHSPKDDAVLWRRTFSEGKPAFTANDGGKELIFSYLLHSAAAKDLLKAHPELGVEEVAIKNKDDGRVIEIVDAKSGVTTSVASVELPATYSSVEGMNRAGDLLYVGGRDRRTLVYSLQTGKQARQIFGYVVGVDPATGRICVTNRQDEALVYEATGAEVAHFHMGNPLRFVQFENHGSSLVILTANQKVSTMELDGVVAGQAAAKAGQ